MSSLNDLKILRWKNVNIKSTRKNYYRKIGTKWFIKVFYQVKLIENQ